MVYKGVLDLFKIYDGREFFYQWDKERKLIVYDDAITEVHFCNKTEECSLKAETYKEGNLTLVNVPNVLLTTDWKINVYAYDKDYTKHCDTFRVIPRSKPDDYIYTEAELKQWEQLQQQLEALEVKVDSFNTDEVEAQVEALAQQHKEDIEQLQAQIDNIEVNNGSFTYVYDGNLDNAFLYQQGVYVTKITEPVEPKELVGAIMIITSNDEEVAEIEITAEMIVELDTGIYLIMLNNNMPMLGILENDVPEMGATKGLYFAYLIDDDYFLYCSKLLPSSFSFLIISKSNEQIE